MPFSNLPSFDAGRVVRFTDTHSVTLGTVTTVDLHPNGTQYDGPAVVVAAFITNGHPVVSVVSLSDPLGLVVTQRADR